MKPIIVGSDHRILTTKLRLSLRLSKSSTTKKVRYGWRKLLTDGNIKELYTAEVNNRFQAFQGLEEDKTSSNTIYKKQTPVKNKFKQHVQWVNINIAEKRRAVFEALDYSNWVETRGSAKKLNDARIKPEVYVKEQEIYV